MTNSPSPQSQREPEAPHPEEHPKRSFNQRLKSLLFSRTAIALGIPLLLGLAGGTWWVWDFINEQLGPLVEQNLAQTLNRPVQLGPVENFSLSSIQFGSASVPATASDPDRVTVETIEVNFNPLRLLFNRTLNLEVTLVNPDIYVQQDRQGRWITTTVQAAEGEGPIRTDLDSIRVRNGKIVLVSNVLNTDKPVPQNTLAIAQVNGVAKLRENNQLIEFDLEGQPAKGGTLALEGGFRPTSGIANIAVQTQNFLASDLTRFLELPLELQAGRIDSNLKVQLNPKKLTRLDGTAQLEKVTAQVRNLPQPFVGAQGTLRFQGTEVRFDDVSAQYGSIPGIANGVLDTASGYNISARVPTVTAANAQKTLNLELPVPVSGVAQANVKVTGPIAKPVLSGTVSTLKTARVDRVNFSRVRAGFTFSAADSVVIFNNIQATPTVGGKITGSGRIRLLPTPQLSFNAVAQNVPGDAIASSYGFTTPNIKIGSVSAKAQVSGSTENPRTVVNWQAPQANYPGTGEVIIVNPNNLLFRDTQFQVAGGRVEVVGQLINKQRWQAFVDADGIELGRLAQVPPTLQTPVNGTFELAGTLPTTPSETLTATGSGKVTSLAGGTIVVPNIEIAGDRWQTQLQATGIELGQLAQVPPQLQGNLAATFNLSGSTNSFQPETLRGTGEGRIRNIAGGTITASNIQLANGKWQTAIQAANVQLSQLSGQLQGELNGQLQAAGTVNAFNLAGISANGKVQLSQSLIGQPVTAAFRWNGDNLLIPQITALNLQASGVVAVRLEGADAPEITGVNFDVQAQNYNLQNLPVQLPNVASLSGTADFTGQISGTLPTPNVKGALQLENLVVNNIGFDPVLAGDIQLTPSQGLDVELVGNQDDRIAVNLDPNYRPNSFTVRLDQAVAIGRTEGQNLLVNVDNFPLRVLNLRPTLPGLGAAPVAGTLSGNFAVNRQTFAEVAGNVAIANPAIGQLQGNQFNAQFSYDNGAAKLSSSEFIKGESRYALTGSFNQTPKGPKFQGEVNIAQGKIQDVLTTLQLFDFQDLQRGLQPADFAEAKDLGTLQVGLPNTSLQTQLRRFSEIEVLLQQQRQQRQNSSPLPPLADLEGTFSGEIAVSGSPQTQIAANFDLTGSNWNWGNYDVGQIIAEGSFDNGVLTLLPLRIESIESEDAVVAFTGQIGGTQQSGQLQVRNFPVEVLDDFVQLPVEFTGELDATATLAGSTANPQAIGELQITEGTLNQKPVESATASFAYADARLNFSSNVVVAGPDPIEASGSIPIQLPFATAKPESNLVSLDLSVQDQGLALINLLTDQVAWQSGQGQVQLEVRGTLDQPVATGLATVQDATITAQALPDPLTDVTGKILFDRDRIVVDSLRGDFSQGEVVAAGVIPIFQNLSPQDPDLENPLTIALEQLELNLEGLYQGGASGNVVITGSAFNPAIGGEVQLADGQVLLPAQTEDAETPTNNNRQTTAATQGQNRQVARASSAAEGGTMVELNDLRLTLEDDVEVILPPILNFEAAGTLNVNGTLNNPRPDGTIRLRGGSVNLFTTQFTLARDYEQTVTFTPKGDLDPVLDLQLVAAVPEVTRTRIPSSSVSSEIADETLSTNAGGLQTVRVEASIQGQASQLFDELELTSAPSRSRSEIISLIGGGFVQTLGRGDAVLGIANLAGSALLSTYQGTFTNIGNALGLSELRLFPTVITDEERSRSSTLGLAAEAGVNITRNIYFSVLTGLTANQSTDFGLTYRLSPQLRVRTSTDLSDESRAVIEYENQF